MFPESVSAVPVADLLLADEPVPDADESIMPFSASPHASRQRYERHNNEACCGSTTGIHHAAHTHIKGAESAIGFRPRRPVRRIDKRFNEQVKRNQERFPSDFMFQLTADEFTALRSQFATLNSGRGQHRKYLPTAFTEDGAIQAANVLASPQAIDRGVFVAPLCACARCAFRLWVI